MSPMPRRRKRQGPSPAAIAAIIAFAVLVVAVITLFAIHRRGSTPTTSTGATSTTTQTSTTQERTSLLVYFEREGRIGAAGRAVATTKAPGRAALEQLLAGPTSDERDAGLATDIPAGTTLDSLAIADGHAHATLSNDLSPVARAEVVFTLTQFPSVKDVVVETPARTTRPLDRKALEAVSPIILVEHPTPGATVQSPLTVDGSANTFEATVQLELTDVTGKVLAKRFLTATSGSGIRGTFTGALSFAAPPGTGLVLTAYESSAEDGSRIHVVIIPLVAG